MSTINQIQLPNGSTYDLEDSAARADIENLKAAATQTTGYAEEIEYRIGINPATGHPAIYHYTKETS